MVSWLCHPSFFFLSLLLLILSFKCQPLISPGTLQVALLVKNSIANAGDIGDTGSIPGLGRSPGGGHGNPLQNSCLENPVDRGTWRSTWGHKESNTTEHTCSLNYLNKLLTSILQTPPPSPFFHQNLSLTPL